MAYDEQNWQSAELIAPAFAHSKSPLGPRPASGPLRAAYVCARQRARLVIDQHYGLDFKNMNTSVPQRYITQNNFVRLAEGYRYVPYPYNYLTAEVIYLHLLDGDAHFRVVAGVSGLSDVGDVFEPANAGIPANFGVYYDRSGPWEFDLWRSAVFSVDLRNVAPGQIMSVYVEGYATLPGTTNANTLLVRHVGVWAELRDD